MIDVTPILHHSPEPVKVIVAEDEVLVRLERIKRLLAARRQRHDK